MLTKLLDIIVVLTSFLLSEIGDNCSRNWCMLMMVSVMIMVVQVRMVIMIITMMIKILLIG